MLCPSTSHEDSCRVMDFQVTVLKICTQAHREHMLYEWRAWPMP